MCHNLAFCLPLQSFVRLLWICCVRTKDGHSTSLRVCVGVYSSFSHDDNAYCRHTRVTHNGHDSVDFFCDVIIYLFMCRFHRELAQRGEDQSV